MRTVFTLLLSALTLIPCAQNNYELTVPGKEWNVLSYGVGVFAVTSVSDNITETIGEPVYIEGQKYFPLYRVAENGFIQYHPGYLREDTLSRRVYFYDHYEDEEGLLYDFGVEEGETVIINNCFTDIGSMTMQCTQIDSTLINGEYKQVFHFNFITWIEGIGSLYGLLYSEIPGLPGGGHELLCCFQNDVPLYQNNTYNSCHVEEFHPEITTEHYDTAYQNSYYEFQLHHTLVPEGDSIRWEAIALPDGLSLDAVSGIISGIPENTGSQACIVVVENNRIGHRTDFLDDDIFVDEATANPTAEKAFKLKIYPNPAKDLISIERNSEKQAKLIIYDANGIPVLSKILQNRIEQIECSGFPKGVYLFKLTENDIVTSRKIAVR